MIYKGSKWLLLRESLPTLKRTLIPTFMKLYNDGIGAYIKEFNQQTQTVTYHNGSQIIFMAESYEHDKELNRFRGLEINGAGIDEINEIREETYNKIIERSGSHIIEGQDIPIKVLATCNPSQNWVKEKFYDRWQSKILPDSWAYIPAKITDNPYVPESYLQSLKENLPELLYNKFVDGDWDIIENSKPFAYCFKPEKHISERAEYNPDLITFLSFDFNVDPATCGVFQFTADYVYMVDEFHLESSDIYQLLDRVKTSQYYNNNLRVTGDASGYNREKATYGLMNMYDIIEKELRLPVMSIETPSSNPSVRFTRVLLNSLLERHKCFLINPRCKHTIKDLQFVQVDEKGDIDKKDHRLTHHIDTVRYFCASFLRNFIQVDFE